MGVVHRIGEEVGEFHGAKERIARCGRAVRLVATISMVVGKELPEDRRPVEGGGFKESPARPLGEGLFRFGVQHKRAWLDTEAKKPGRFAAGLSLAEREGFEPPVPLRAHLFSRQTRSTTPAPLRTGRRR
jgi:hypothetical protein